MTVPTQAELLCQRAREFIRGRKFQEAIAAGKKFNGGDFERMQHDVVSLPARRFQGILRAWKPARGGREEAVRRMLLEWDARVTADSVAACIFEVWIAKLPVLALGEKVGRRADLSVVLDSLERHPRPDPTHRRGSFRSGAFPKGRADDRHPCRDSAPDPW